MFKRVAGLILVVFFISCAKPLYKKKFIISGTYLEITSPYQNAAAIVYREFRRLDKVFNLYDPDSEISRLNRTYNKPFKASPELIEALNLSREVYRLSEGAFDASYGALYKFWKELINRGDLAELPSSETIAGLRGAGGVDGLEVDSQNGTVLIKKKGLLVDLSGIAKGFMIDKAVARLKEEGIESALINAGGDIYCLGLDCGQPWEIGIKNPDTLSEILGVRFLIDEAIATSGGYEQFFTFQGRNYSHLIDPRQGYPAENDLLSVSVIAKNCTTADGLATAFSILGLEGVKKFFSQTPSTMRVFLVRSAGGEKKIDIFK